MAEVRQCQGAPSSWKQEPRPAGDPRNVCLNPKGVSAQLAAFEPLLSPPRPESPSESLRKTGPVAGTTPAPGGGFRVDPELEAKIPAGRYAVEGEDGNLKFYRIDKPTKGPWAGRTFVKVQASGELYPVRSSQSRAGILRKIAADVRAAAVRYGWELGICSQCGRTLTDPESIAAGIGPICASKL